MPKPDIHLGVGSGSHAVQTAKIMTEFEPVVLAEKPDWVLVVGDVNSTIACCSGCAKLGVKVAHVEAGLRSGDRRCPRRSTGYLRTRSQTCSLPPRKTPTKISDIQAFPPIRYDFVGNVMIDSLLDHLKIAESSTVRDDLGIDDDDYAVLTLHRPSNVDERETFSGYSRRS